MDWVMILKFWGVWKIGDVAVVCCGIRWSICEHNSKGKIANWRLMMVKGICYVIYVSNVSIQGTSYEILSAHDSVVRSSICSLHLYMSSCKFLYHVSKWIFKCYQNHGSSFRGASNYHPYSRHTFFFFCWL